MRYQYRFNTKERARAAVLEAITNDPAATPAARLSALRCLERLEAAARRRAEGRPAPPAEPAPTPEPTIDDLVAALEARKSPPECPANAIGGDYSPDRPSDESVQPELPKQPESSEVTEVTAVPAPPAPPEPAFAVYEGRCAGCGLVLCGCDRGEKATPPTWEGDPNAAGHSLAAIHGNPLGMAASVRIWQQQATDEQEERARLIRQIRYEESKNRF